MPRQIGGKVCCECARCVSRLDIVLCPGPVTEEVSCHLSTAQHLPYPTVRDHTLQCAVKRSIFLKLVFLSSRAICALRHWQTARTRKRKRGITCLLPLENYANLEMTSADSAGRDKIPVQLGRLPSPNRGLGMRLPSRDKHLHRLLLKAVVVILFVSFIRARTSRGSSP